MSQFIFFMSTIMQATQTNNTTTDFHTKDIYHWIRWEFFCHLEKLLGKVKKQPPEVFYVNLQLN